MQLKDQGKTQRELDELKQEFMGKFSGLCRMSIVKESLNTDNVWQWIEQKLEEQRRVVFEEVESELHKHKFDTDMTGWDIVPKLMATMQLLRSKFITPKPNGE